MNASAKHLLSFFYLVILFRLVTTLSACEFECQVHKFCTSTLKAASSCSRATLLFKYLFEQCQVSKIIIKRLAVSQATQVLQVGQARQVVSNRYLDINM